MTIGSPTSSSAPNTEVSHVPRNGLRHVLGSAGGGTGMRAIVRHRTFGKPYSGSGATRAGGPGGSSTATGPEPVLTTGADPPSSAWDVPFPTAWPAPVPFAGATGATSSSSADRLPGGSVGPTVVIGEP